MLFAADTIPALHRYSGGVPRLINTLCDNCLFETYMLKQTVVDLKIVHSVAGDLGLLRQPLVEIAPAPRGAELDEIDSLLDRLEQKF
jgi:hypothetical protein